MIKIEKLKEKIPVYDITVDGNNNFFGNDNIIFLFFNIILYVTKITKNSIISKMIL